MSHNILFVNTPPYIGGAEVSLLILAAELQRRGHHCWLLTTSDGPLAQRADELGISVLLQPFPWFSHRKPWHYCLAIWRIGALLRKFRIDLVHTSCDHSLSIMRRACRLAGRPYVSHVQDFVRNWFQAETLAGLKGARFVLANSQAIAHASAAAGIPVERIATVYNPIDVDALRPTASHQRNAARERLNLPSDALVIGLVGQIQAIKGHREFVLACASLAPVHTSAYFLIIGEPPPDPIAQAFAQEIRAMIAGSPHAHQFREVEFQQDIGPMLRSIDILAVPSWNEPFGRVAVEGMAAGCAVVATDAGGLPEIVTHDTDGLLVPPHNADALAAAFHRLARDPALRAQLSEAGIESAKKFNIAHHVDAFERLYCMTLKMCPPRGTPCCGFECDAK
ncbi:MAG: glycosyltransferase family 4 protein [Chloroflexota bacterium]